jgi:hypothetical protein
MLLPAVAFGVYWVLLLMLKVGDNRDANKLKALQMAKRSMIRELKVLTLAGGEGGQQRTQCAAAPPSVPSRSNGVVCAVAMAGNLKAHARQSNWHIQHTAAPAVCACRRCLATTRSRP